MEPTKTRVVKFGRFAVKNAKVKAFKKWLKKARTLKTAELWESAKTKLRDHRDDKLAAKVAIHLCHRYNGEKLKEIGERFGFKESAVSQPSRRLAMEQGKDKKLQDIVNDLVKRLNICNV